MATKVIFRKYNDGDVIALFPAMAGDSSPNTCGSYMHIGQHSAASADIVQCTKLAKPDEYAELQRELERIGYDDLLIRKRFTYADYLARADQCRA